MRISCIGGGKVNWYNSFGGQLGNISKLKISTPYGGAVPFLSVLSPAGV